jgi:signal peptidase I
VLGALRLLRPFRVEVAGSSMSPELLPGDWLVATRPRHVLPGHVVVLRHPDGTRDLVKRVAAVPGDRVGERRLGREEYLVVGDNAAASTDGRAFGPVAGHAIEGVVRFRYWPRPGVVGRGRSSRSSRHVSPSEISTRRPSDSRSRKHSSRSPSRSSRHDRSTSSTPSV